MSKELISRVLENIFIYLFNTIKSIMLLINSILFNAVNLVIVLMQQREKRVISLKE